VTKHSVARLAAAVCTTAAAVVLSPASSLAQTSPPPGVGTGDIPSVAVSPADPPKPGDPNGGQWFVLELKQGTRGAIRAKIGNPAKVAQRVHLSVNDLVFADDGTPSVRDDKQEDVGLWSNLGEKSDITVPAEKTVVVTVNILVPPTADPGDHVGAFVATTTNRQGTSLVNRRIATRLYVTVPGEAITAFEVGDFGNRIDDLFFPGAITSTVTIRNTGRIRLRPTVTVSGTKASGATTLLARSVEPYVAQVKVPWYGGPVKLKALVVTDTGQTRLVTKSMFIIPWGLLATAVVGVLVLLGLALVFRRWRRNRASKHNELRSDLERLERLVTRQVGAGEPEPVTVEPDPEGEEIHGIVVALKRASRSGSPRTLARLALALDELGGPALPWLLTALVESEEADRDALIDAVLRHPSTDVVAAAREQSVPTDLVDYLDQLRPQPIDEPTYEGQLPQQRSADNTRKAP
jgi:hypothetical protein